MTHLLDRFDQPYAPPRHFAKLCEALGALRAQQTSVTDGVRALLCRRLPVCFAKSPPAVPAARREHGAVSVLCSADHACHPTLRHCHSILGLPSTLSSGRAASCEWALAPQPPAVPFGHSPHPMHDVQAQPCTSAARCRPAAAAAPAAAAGGAVACCSCWPAARRPVSWAADPWQQQQRWMKQSRWAVLCEAVRAAAHAVAGAPAPCTTRFVPAQSTQTAQPQG